MKFKQNLGFFILISVLMSASVSCLPYKYSSKSKGELVSMQLNTDTLWDYQEMEPQIASRGGLDIAGKVVSLCGVGIKKLIEMERKKYTAEYAGAAVNNYFYNMPSARGPLDPSGMQFSGFEFLRTVKVKRKIDTAVYFKVSVDNSNPYDIVNNSVFRLKLDKIVVKHAKAKIPGFRWYLPWTLLYKNSRKNTLNLDVDVAIYADWITNDLVMNKNVEVDRFAFSLRNAPLDPQLGTYRSFYQSLEGSPLGGYSFIVPRSFGYYLNATKATDPCWGQGIYAVYVNVKEAGREKLVTRLLFDNSSKIIDGISNKLAPAEE